MEKEWNQLLPGVFIGYEPVYEMVKEVNEIN